MTEADAWAAEVGTRAATVLPSQEKKKRRKKCIVKQKKNKKRPLVLSVTPASSYRSVFKPTGLP